MKTQIFLLVFIITILNYSQNNLKLIDLSPAFIDTTYQIPVFNDPERMKMIEAALPII